jgi:DNA modification methylase
MGSGSTVIACRNINRNYIGIENDPEYFNKALEWIKSYNQIDPFVTEEEVSHDTDNPLLNALY